MSLYLDVPYDEKAEMKALGAKWNSNVKKWCADVSPEDYRNFSKWLLKDRRNTTIAIDGIYIIEGEGECSECREKTKLVGLGVNRFVNVYINEDRDVSQYLYMGRNLSLSWADDESDLPPKILNYLKENYSVKTETNFANFCDHCGAMQSNWAIFSDFDSPLSPIALGEDQAEKVSALKIIKIPIKDALVLNFNPRITSEDYAYLEYGKVTEHNFSSDPKGATYEELYEVK